MFPLSQQEHGAAYDAGGLEVGQLILEVDGNKVDGMHHQVRAGLLTISRTYVNITLLISGRRPTDSGVLRRTRQERYHLSRSRSKEIKPRTETNSINIFRSIAFAIPAG